MAIRPRPHQLKAQVSHGRDPWWNGTRRQVPVSGRSPRFHAVSHKSPTPLQHLHIVHPEMKRSKPQTLGQSVCYKLVAAASYFASGKYFMLQEKLLLLTPSLPLSHAHTHAPQVDWALMLTGEENCFLTFPVINLHPGA